MGSRASMLKPSTTKLSKMKPKSKKKLPGSIFKRASRETLYIKYKGKEYATGYRDNPLGWKLAERQLEQMYLSNLRNEGRADQSTNIRDHWEAFLAYKRLRVATATVNLYILAMKRINLLDCKLNRVEIESKITQFVNQELSSGKLHKRTINILLRDISVFLNYLHQNELLPAIKISNFKVEAGKKEYMDYSDEEISQIYSYFKTTDNEFALYVMLMRLCGGRRGETIKLTWEQVDFTAKTITFPVKNQKLNSDKFPITPEIEEILLTLRAKNKEKVFRWSPNSVKTLRLKLVKCEKVLGIYRPGRSFHSLRKSFAASLFKSKLSLDVTQKLMRHKNINTTIESYHNFTTQDLLNELKNVPKMSPNI